MLLKRYKKVMLLMFTIIAFMFINNSSVFADEEQNYYINYRDDHYNDSTYGFYLDTTQETNTSIDATFTLYDKYKINFAMTNTNKYYGYYYLLYNKKRNSYFVQYLATKEELNFNYSYGLQFYHTDTDRFRLAVGEFDVYYNSDFKNIKNGLDRSKYTNKDDYYTMVSQLGRSREKIYEFIIEDNALKMRWVAFPNSSEQFIYEDELELVSTNIKSNIYKYHNVTNIVSRFYDYKSIPSTYEKIDMKDKYAVVFYPKDVRNLNKKCTKTEEVYETDDDGNVSIVKKCVEESYVTTFWHNGNFNILNSDIQNMNYVEHPVTSNAMNDLFEETLLFKTDEFKNAIIFYNNAQNQHTDSDGNVSVIDYGGNGVIYYDPSLFNYFFVEKPDSEINEDISYIDADGNEQNVKVDTLPKQDAYVDFNLGFNENTIKKFDAVSAFKSFINMISDGASFFKKYINLFLKNVPDFVYYFIIFIPILSIIIAVLKIVNNR